MAALCSAPLGPREAVVVAGSGLLGVVEGMCRKVGEVGEVVWEGVERLVEGSELWGEVEQLVEQCGVVVVERLGAGEEGRRQGVLLLDRCW